MAFLRSLFWIFTIPILLALVAVPTLDWYNEWQSSSAIDWFALSEANEWFASGEPRADNETLVPFIVEVRFVLTAPVERFAYSSICICGLNYESLFAELRSYVGANSQAIGRRVDCRSAGAPESAARLRIARRNSARTGRSLARVQREPLAAASEPRGAVTVPYRDRRPARALLARANAFAARSWRLACAPAREPAAAARLAEQSVRVLQTGRAAHLSECATSTRPVR